MVGENQQVVSYWNTAYSTKSGSLACYYYYRIEPVNFKFKKLAGTIWNWPIISNTPTTAILDCPQWGESPVCKW